MRPIDLTEEVNFIGNGNTADDHALLIASANKALREIYLRIPIVKKVRLCVRSLKPVVYYPKIEVANGISTILPLEGKAYSMRVVGKGMYSIVDGSATAVTQFSTGTDSKIVRGFISKGGTIEFWGTFAVSVYDFAIFDRVFAPETESIPLLSPTRIYDMREIYGDFLSFVSPVTDKYGKVIENCSLYDGKVEIDSSYDGETIVTYRRLPQTLSPYNADIFEKETIDIPPEYENLLIYLTAYNYWMISDEINAKMFKDRFEALISSAEGHYQSINHSYVDTNGWA